MNREGHKRFHIDLAPEEDALLSKLAAALTKKLGVRVTRIATTAMAIKLMAKQEKVK